MHFVAMMIRSLFLSFRVRSLLGSSSRKSCLNCNCAWYLQYGHRSVGWVGLGLGWIHYIDTVLYLLQLAVRCWSADTAAVAGLLLRACCAGLLPTGSTRYGSF